MITKMITCWRIALTNGENLFFTDSDQNIFFQEEEYIAGSNFTPNSIINSNELGQDNFTITGIIDNKFFTKENILNGNLSNAYIEIFLLNLTHNLLEKTILKTGWLGEIRLSNNSFTIEISSIGIKTNNLIGKCYSSSCRAEFGDRFCQKKREDYSYLGKISSTLGKNSFIDNDRAEPDNFFDNGTLIFNSGKYQNKKYNVISFHNKIIYLDSNINLKLIKGDIYRITIDCDKSLETCINKFNNVLNFRGEPYIPGKYKLLARN